MLQYVPLSELVPLKMYIDVKTIINFVIIKVHH